MRVVVWRQLWARGENKKRWKYEKKKIVGVIEDLSAGGSTAGSKGIRTAYNLAEKYFIEGGNNRVILATDGDFNVGLTVLEDLENYIARKRKSGVYFSVFSYFFKQAAKTQLKTYAVISCKMGVAVDSVNYIVFFV